MSDEQKPFPFFDPNRVPSPPFPMRRKKFRELKHFVILMYTKDSPKGITGYQLQEQYNIPRGTAVRMLNELEENAYLDTKKEIIDGRAHKFFSLTEKGENYLEDLKGKWATRFAILSKVASPERYNRPFSRTPMKFLIERVREFSSKKDVVDFFQKMHSHIQKHEQHLQQRIQFVQRIRQVTEHILDEIEAMKAFNFEKIKTLIEKGHQQLANNFNHRHNHKFENTMEENK